MTRNLLSGVCAAAAFTVLFSFSAVAQDSVSDADSVQTATMLAIQTATGPRTSLWDPPEEDDTTFVTDAAPKLDTGCLFRSGGPITFPIKVTRVAGEINPDGTLKSAQALIDAGYVEKNATLTMPGFDVDDKADVSQFGLEPEIDLVSFNGVRLQANGVDAKLIGTNNQWEQNTFTVPIELIKFPAPGANGSAPVPAENEVRIDIDTANTGET